MASGAAAAISRMKALEAKKQYAERFGKTWESQDQSELDDATVEFHSVSVAQCKRLVLGRLERYRRPEPPVRPAHCNLSDNVLANDVRAWRRQKSKLDEQNLKEFLSWRGLVMDCESKSASNLVLLLSHLWHARGANDAEVSIQLERFVVNEYGVQLGGIELNPDTVRMLAYQYSRREDVLSDCLLESKSGWGRSSDREATPKQMSVYED